MASEEPPVPLVASTGSSASSQQTTLPPTLYVDDSTDQDLAARERADRIQEITADPESVIADVVATWSAMIEMAGGHPSQLESTLRAADADTLLRISEAETLTVINEILGARSTRSSYE
jgi:hypothetical protein